MLLSLVFIDVVSADTYNNYNPVVPFSCGNNMLTDIPQLLPKVISIIYTVIIKHIVIRIFTNSVVRTI